MNNFKPTLVILAAGIGSRYGGLKQLDTFTPEGATILDFSIYDAIQAGFGKIVFIIRKEIEVAFKEIFRRKWGKKIRLEYVFQEVENIPKEYKNSKREKPWGTGHALLMVKEIVQENFAIINADDFYGREAFKTMAAFLLKNDIASYNFSMIAYVLKNTVSKYGSVSRGECQVSTKGYLKAINERTQIEIVNGSLKYKNEKGDYIPIDKNTIVSMNFWGFTPKCFEFTTTLFKNFLEENSNNLKAEFFIPLIINEIIKSNVASVKVLQSNAKWFGVTYKEDKKRVEQKIKKLRDLNKYPSKLW